MLSTHHESPCDFYITTESKEGIRQAEWQPADTRAYKAWANTDDATRDGAYVMAIAAVEAELGMYAFERASTRTGADYYIGEQGVDDLEHAYRLEVSGTNRGTDAEVQRRLVQKLEQTIRGDSDRPAVACVVGFEVRRIAIARTEDE